jgi:ketosteroid isomerase-like protein
MSAADLFRAYLDRFTSGDIAGAAELLDEDFSFHGPMLQSEGKASFIDGASGLGPIVRGNRIIRQWVADAEVCSIYEFDVETPAGAGSITMAEWTTVRDGKLASSRLIFDTAAMAALMPAA